MPSAAREGPESLTTSLFGFGCSRSLTEERFSTRIDARNRLYVYM